MAALLRMSLCALLVSAPAALGAESLPLPPSFTEFLSAFPTPAEVGDGLSRGEFRAESCRVERGQLSCSCLASAGRTFDTWASGEASGMTVRDNGRFLIAHSAIEVDGSWVLADVWFVAEDKALHADELHVTGTAAQMSGLSWHRAEQAPSMACNATFAPSSDAELASARGATLGPAGWRLAGYKVGPWPVPAARSAYRTAPGALPPIVRAAPDVLEMEVSAALWAGLFGAVAGGVGVPVSAGLGLGTWRHDDARALRGLVAYDAERGLEPVVLGDIALGELTHVRGHFEHPASADIWSARRLELGGSLRNWRQSHVGAAVSGPAHALQISGSVASEPDLPDDLWSGVLRYGSVIDSGRHARWTLDVEHVSDRGASTRHSTTAALGFRAPFGWEDRLWLTPGGDVIANYGAVSAAQGLDASTTLTALGTVEAGLALAGRWDGAVHRLAPVLRVGGELGGVQQRQAREGAPDYPFVRPDRWRWAMLALDQSIRQGRVNLELPAGLYVDALGDERVGDEVSKLGAFARAAVVSTGGRLDAGLACMDACERVGVRLGAMLRPTRHLEVGYVVTDLSAREVALMHADAMTTHGFQMLRLLEDPDDAAAFAHRASLAIRRGGGFGRLGGAYGTSAESRGITGELGWRWARLGWGISASGAYVPQTEDWAMMAGLSLGQ